jgi:CheY-like chemotaxis protein
MCNQQPVDHGSLATNRPALAVLVVTSDAALAELLREGLRREGYRQASAVGGTEARDLLRRWQFDLVIIDSDLPDTQCFVLCAELRRWTEMPIIMIGDNLQPWGLRLSGPSPKWGILMSSDSFH